MPGDLDGNRNNLTPEATQPQCYRIQCAMSRFQGQFRSTEGTQHRGVYTGKSGSLVMGCAWKSVGQLLPQVSPSLSLARTGPQVFATLTLMGNGIIALLLGQLPLRRSSITVLRDVAELTHLTPLTQL